MHEVFIVLSIFKCSEKDYVKIRKNDWEINSP
jgi:hypothetical protein